jgi:hypothetical protein
MPYDRTALCVDCAVSCAMGFSQGKFIIPASPGCMSISFEPLRQATSQIIWVQPDHLTNVSTGKEVIGFFVPEPLCCLPKENLAACRLTEGKLPKCLNGFAQHREQKCLLRLRQTPHPMDVEEPWFRQDVRLKQFCDVVLQVKQPPIAKMSACLEPWAIVRPNEKKREKVETYFCRCENGGIAAASLKRTVHSLNGIITASVNNVHTSAAIIKNREIRGRN